MDIENVIFEVLTEDTDLGAIVGTRVYPLALPQNPTLPAIVYQELRGQARAAAGGDTGQRESRFQLSYWAGSFSAIKVGKRLLINRLSGYSGEGVELIKVDGLHDNYDAETGWFQQVVEVEVMWVEE